MIPQTPQIRALAAAVACLLPLASWAADQADARVDAMALYNQGAAVVQDAREIDLAAGDQQIAWPVRGRLRPDTLWLDAEGVELTGFGATVNGNSEADPLAARIGQPVTLVRDGAIGNVDHRERSATLVSLVGDAIYVRVNGHIERLTPASPWQISWPAAGDDGDDTPADGGLSLNVDADKAGRQRLTATYQIDGPRWQASYTGRFDPETGKLSLQSMAVIDNSGGAALSADSAWLVAGDVARANNNMPRPMMMARSEAKMSDSAPQAAGDTYRYALDGPLDVPAGGVRAVSMMDSVAFQATRSYRFQNSWYERPDGKTRSHAEVRLAFDNSSDRPLPAGAVRVYDGAGKARLMGEDTIGDTPTKAPVMLTLGRSFDVTSTRQIVSEDAGDNGQRERTVKLELYNAGERDAAIDISEQLPEGAKIVSASITPQADGAANTGEWAVKLGAGGQRQLIYTVRWPANG
ncbi:DUF4139 domain-containing protein [Salinisphaera aquimarina]|uniref:DUF4139 domain-containing protein n=1 Tax=Salinisphaera aquimarina TaxID=2094031 RepID=A0ABV7ET82_9GAMM